MFCLVGLGNPGQKYHNTRHNAGFLVIDRIIGQLPTVVTKNAHHSIISRVKYGDRDLLLVKPQTFMNCSGEAVNEVVNYYKIDQNQLLIIYDDLDLKLGAIRLRPAGSAGGHRGLSSVITCLNTSQISRLRVGIDRPNDGRLVVDYVLTPVAANEQSGFEKGINRAADAALDFVIHGINHAMNHYNTEVQPE